MKVLHLNSERTWRGGEQQLAYLAEAQLSKGLEVLIACRSGSALEKHAKARSWAHASLAFASHAPGTALALRRLIRNEKISLCHLHTSKAHGAGVLAHLLGAGVPMVLHRRVAFPPGGNPLTRFKYRYPGIRKIICISTAIQRLLDRYLGRAGRTVVIHSGVEIIRQDQRQPLHLRERHNLAPQTRLIGNVAALTREKGHFVFIDAAAALLKDFGEDLCFFIFGDGPLRPDLQARIDSRGLTGKIILEGFVSDIRYKLHELDLFFSATESEGLGSSLLDAMANDVPVIASNVGGIPDVVIDDHTGLLVEPDDPSGMVTKMRHLLLNPAECRRLVHNGRKHLEARFSREHMTTEVERVYEEVLSARPSTMGL